MSVITFGILGYIHIFVVSCFINYWFVSYPWLLWATSSDIELPGYNSRFLWTCCTSYLSN